MSGCLLAGTAFAAAPASEPPDVPGSHFTSLANGIPHPTFGCDGAVVLTPQPGTEFADPLQGTPASATSFYAKAARLHMTWASTLDCTDTGLTHGLVPSGPNTLVSGGAGPDTTTQFSTNWSGYQIDNGAQYVQSGWTIPTVVNPPLMHQYSTTGYYSSTWTGIGGGLPNSDPLIQAGSDQQLSASHVATYYFWWEIVGGTSDTNGEKMFTPSPVAHPGDDVGSASIWLRGSSNADSSAEFSVCDFSDSSPPGGCVQMLLTCNPAQPSTCTPPPGNTVEWIVEAPLPCPSCTPLPLADFGEVNFYNACWAAIFTDGAPVDCSAISVPGLTAPFSWELGERVFGESYYQILAQPGALTSDSSFTDGYYLPERGGTN